MVVIAVSFYLDIYFPLLLLAAITSIVIVWIMNKRWPLSDPPIQHSREQKEGDDID